MNTTADNNILVFDSGVGGLSVYQELTAKLPQLSYTYLFDNFAYPYGELPQETLIHRVVALVSEQVRLRNIQLVVIACNTASTIVLPHLREALTIPVVGVVPAIKPASLIAKKGVGVIATPATVSRQYTHDLIRHFSADKPVRLLGSTRLVDMAEEKLRGKAVCLNELASVLEPIKPHIDVAVLGCTHFPLLREEIGQVLGEGVALIDSGEAIARRVADLLGLESGEKRVGLNTIIASAPPFDGDALSRSVAEMGFAKIQLLPNPDV